MPALAATGWRRHWQEWRRGLSGRVQMDITPAGWGFALLILCSFLLSINFSNNLIFAMTFLLTGIAVIGAYATRGNVRGLTLAEWQAQPVFAGQEALYRVRVENRSKRDRWALAVAGRGLTCKEEIALAAGRSAELTLRRKAVRRGLLPARTVLLRSAFPLGLFEARLSAGTLPELIVYPQPAGEQPLPGQERNQSAHRLREAGAYTDLRRYGAGDPLSRISWRAYARFDQLFTKEFDGGQGQEALWLRWEDVRADDAEARLSQLCRWALDCQRAGREYGLALPGQRIEPGREETHLRHCLRTLALFGQEEAQS